MHHVAHIGLVHPEAPTMHPLILRGQHKGSKVVVPPYTLLFVPLFIIKCEACVDAMTGHGATRARKNPSLR